MSDVFEELFSLLTPERLLHDPRANGQGVSVCVIDSGVERAQLEERFRTEGQQIERIEGGVFVPGRAEPLPYEGRQSTPHGTIVADIILRVAPRVRLYSADILGPAATCEVEMLTRALRWAIHVWKCKVINLSLGITEQRMQQVAHADRQDFQRAIEEGYYRDVLIIAAAHNDHPLTRCYPAAFAPPLLSVDKSLFDSPLGFAYQLHEQIEFQAHSRGYLGPFAQEPATSWAAPHLSGIAARILSLRPTLKPFEMKAILYWLARAGQGRNGQASREG
jgi:subtilisin